MLFFSILAPHPTERQGEIFAGLPEGALATPASRGEFKSQSDFAVFSDDAGSEA